MRRNFMGFGLGLLWVAAAPVAWAQPSDALTAARDGLPQPNYAVVETDIGFQVAGETVIGTLALPDGLNTPPVALMLHGFTGSRDELGIEGTDEGVYSRTARIWAERGLASLRIDFRGSGESGGAWEDTTFTGQIADALAAVDWLAQDGRVEGSTIALFGWSQGGLIASAIAAQHSHIGTTALWAPVTHPPSTYSAILGAGNVAAGLASGGAPVTITLPWGAEIALKTGFFEELYLVDPLVSIADYAGPLLVIVGTRDTVVFPQPLSGQAFIATHDGEEELLVLDTDHVWDAFTGPDTVDEMALWTMAWFGMTR